MFRTYRFRLIAYTGLLLAFLCVTLAYTYIYSRNVILEEAENNITNTAQVLNGNREMEEMELLHYTEIARDDLRIQEYMFMAVKVGTDSEPLKTLYDRQFGWLPIDRRVLITSTGRVLFGEENPDLVAVVTDHLRGSNEEIFYFQGINGLEMVTWARIQYQGDNLGVIALTRVLNSAWLERHHHFSSGLLFIEYDGVIQLSSLPEAEGKPFQVTQLGKLTVNNERYSIRPVILNRLSKDTPRLWYGVSEQDLLAKLERHSRLILMLTLAGGGAILLMGLMIVHNFNKPLTELMQMVRAVAQGSIPVMNKSGANNEIGMLSNQFAEMLQALREKQEEIDRVHKKLEQSAITDALTKLYNRRYLQTIFPKIIGQAQRESLCLSGLMLDIDYFKEINDRYGHLAGDDCLVHISQVVLSISRASDFVFRIGGEEFFILSVGDVQEGGRLLAEKIRSAVEQQPTSYKNSIIPMTGSIGVSHADTSLAPDQALTHLLFHADRALYQAKASGRNQVRVYVSARNDPQSIWDFVS